MDKLVLENFRCFRGRQEVPLAPLTVLVGENSSGKSSFLAAVRLAWDIAAGRGVVDFNEAPFNLGSYDQIATDWGRGRGRVRSFVLGQDLVVRRIFPSKTAKIRVEGKFVQHRTQPYLSELLVQIRDTLSVVMRSMPETVLSASVISGQDTWELPPSPLDRVVHLLDARSQLSYSQLSTYLNWLNMDTALDLLPKGVADALAEAPLWLSTPEMSRPLAFAPIRSHPQRTYDLLRDEPAPEGGHVPMLLARLLEEAGEQSTTLREALLNFGTASGLFSEVAIRHLGRASDPFQVMVRNRGPRRNLIDVGYGVSQILPIVVEVATAPPKSTYLIQQPEIHLHPRAQASLASLFGTLVRERKCRIIVETHSDYFIDRIRMDIRDAEGAGLENFSLLYFDRTNDGTTIHPIGIDHRGNVVECPPNYRSFFLEEERRFFGVG